METNQTPRHLRRHVDIPLQKSSPGAPRVNFMGPRVNFGSYGVHHMSPMGLILGGPGHCGWALVVFWGREMTIQLTSGVAVLLLVPAPLDFYSFLSLLFDGLAVKLLCRRSRTIREYSSFLKAWRPGAANLARRAASRAGQKRF